MRTLTGKSLLAVVGIFVLSTQAHAINRYTSTAMTCAGVSDTIAREGAAIMRYTSPRTGNLLYDRYVASRSFCAPGETTKGAFIPSSDGQSCPVNRCVQIEFPEFR